MNAVPIFSDRRKILWVIAARVWTFTALAVTSPLFVEPAIQAFVPSLNEWDNVLMPTILVLGFAFFVNLFFNLGQLMFCVKPPLTPSERTWPPLLRD